MEIDWHVADRGGRMLITDVFVDGVSMKVTQRQGFASIIQRNGGRADALLATLRQELAMSEPQPTGAPDQQMLGPRPPAAGSSSEPVPAPPSPSYHR